MDLYDKLDVKHEWTTPIGSIDIYLPDIVRQVLIRILTNCKNISTYNLFDFSDKSFSTIEERCLKDFEEIASKIIRTYVKKAWEWDEEVKIKARCFGNVQRSFSRRNAPHYYHGWDGVFIHYLTIGEEFNYPLFDAKANEKLTEIASKAKHGRKMLDTIDSEATHSDHSGDLIFLDPRHSIKMPYNNKAKIIKPKVGTTLIHPAYLWHETETHTKPGIRVTIIINFNIENSNYDLIPTYLV